MKNYLHSQFVSSCPSISSELLLSRACSFEDREFALANSQENYFHRLAQGLDKFQYICSKNAFRPSQTPIFSTSLPTPSQYTQLNEVGHQSRQPSTQMGSQRQASSPSNSQPFFVNQSLASSQYPNHVGAFTQGQMANSASASTQQPCLPLNNISTGQFYPKHNESNGNVNFYSPSVHIPYTKPKSTIQQKPPKPPARSGIAISKVSRMSLLLTYMYYNWKVHIIFGCPRTLTFLFFNNCMLPCAEKTSHPSLEEISQSKKRARFSVIVSKVYFCRCKSPFRGSDFINATKAKLPFSTECRLYLLCTSPREFFNDTRTATKSSGCTTTMCSGRIPTQVCSSSTI